MHTIAVIVGTMPEAVKLGPVCRELQRHRSWIRTRIILSGQHRGLKDLLGAFAVAPSEQVDGLMYGVLLPSMAAGILSKLSAAFRRLRPSLVVVQGDTTTAFAGAMAAFYEGIPVAHVEAGLTTGNVAHPLPEELHREVISKLATQLFGFIRLERPLYR